MTTVKSVQKDDVEPTEPTANGDWKAKFEVELSDREFSPIGKFKINGRFTSEGQRYFYGFNPEAAPNHWVFRLDFSHFNFQAGVDYKVGSGGFGALFVQGGSEMISGGTIVEGTMRIKDMDPDKGIVKGEFINVKTEGGRPDGTDMDPAYAKSISFETVLEKVEI